MVALSVLIRRDLGMLREHTLLEGSNYMAMFERLFAAMQATPDRRRTVQQTIVEARRVLRRNDRIVWFLRWYRLGLINNAHIEARGNPERQAKLSVLYDRELAALGGEPRARVETSAMQIARSPLPVLQRLDHFLSLPIPAIQDRVFGKETIMTLVDEFKAAEAAWQESRRGLIFGGAGDASKLIDFGNGWAWWNLNVASCSREAAAMGHCGNSPRADSDDRVLSLRQQIERDGQTVYKPYLTFILLDDGTLGEMKGRFNKSPDHAFQAGTAPSNFHREIIALLRLPLIKGITGGGYLPQENFKLSDLPAAERDALAREKPSLLTPREQYRMFGLTDEVMAALARLWDPMRGTLEYRADLKGFVVGREISLSDFIIDYVHYNTRDQRMATALWLWQVLTGEIDVDAYVDHVSESDRRGMLDAFEAAHPDVYARLQDWAVAAWKEENSTDDDDDDVPDDLLELLEDTDIISMLDTAVQDAVQRGAENEMSSAFWSWVDDLQRPDKFWINLPAGRTIDSNVLVLADPEGIFDMLEDEEEPGPSDVFEVTDISEPQYGWDGFDKAAGVEYLLDNLPAQIVTTAAAK